jgi:hypothetical protein
MMNGVVASPRCIGDHRQDAEDAPEQIIGPPGAEIGAVAAIMLDDEEPNDKERGRQRQEERRPDALRKSPEEERGDRSQGHAVTTSCRDARTVSGLAYGASRWRHESAETSRMRCGGVDWSVLGTMAVSVKMYLRFR